MKLIIGGAYQGKKKFAQDHLQMGEEDFVDGRSCEFGSLKNAKGMHHLQDYIRRMLQVEMDAKEIVLLEVSQNSEIVLLCNELGCGLVPIEAFDRNYRETVGRILCELAKDANAVYRVYCGIGVKIQ